MLTKEYCEFSVPGGSENTHGKVNILMQTYLSRGYIKCLSLASDMEYIIQVILKRLCLYSCRLALFSILECC